MSRHAKPDSALRDVIDLKDPSYTPVRLINETAHILQAKNDAQLALLLEINLSQLSRVRHRKAPVTSRILVKIMDRTGWHIQYVRELMGVPFDGAAKLVVLEQHVGARGRRAFLAGAAA